MDEVTSRKVEGKKSPVSGFSIALLLLMFVVGLFLILVQNIDRFSTYFGSTTFKIIFDVALFVLFIVVVVYIFHRDAAYRKTLETMVDQLQESNMHLQLLNAIQSRANATADVEQLFEESLEAVMTLMSSRGVIYLMDEETSKLKPLVCFGSGIQLESLQDFSVGEGMVGWVAQSGQPMEDNDGAGGMTRGAKGSRKTTLSRIAIPIKAGNKVMGVMFADTTKGSYSQAEKTLLLTVSEMMGNSLTSTKLYDITRRALDTSKRTQSYLESFILEAKIGALVIDNNGAVLIANREVERYLQVQLRDILGKNAPEVLGQLGWRGQRLVQGLTTCLQDKSAVEYSHPLDDDPTSLAVLVNVFPLFREKGELIGAAATLIRT